MAGEIKPVIYQLVVRYFGNVNPANRIDGTLEQNGVGKFAHVSDIALASLKKLGITHVWLTGVLRQATLTDYSAIGLPADDPDVVKGIAGSFYAVRDYFDVCPDYALDPTKRLEEFDALLKRIHSAGMKALIDLVPNHVARGYASVVRPEISFGEGDDTSKFFDAQNHFFYLVDPPGQALKVIKPGHWNPHGVTFDERFAREDGGPGRPPKVTGNNAMTAEVGPTDWYETVKLNYGFDFVHRTGHYDPRPRTWEVVDQILAYWQGRGVDGFRCDFAHYVPPGAWKFLIDQARRRKPDVYFFAEAYPWEGSGDPITDRQQLVDAGFDAIYHDESYNRLKRIYQHKGGLDDYNEAMVSLSASVRSHTVQYLENHDERRIASPLEFDRSWSESGFGTMEAGYQLAPLQFLFSPGPVLMLNGQEVGEPAAGASGYSGDDGRTTLFDYWSMPEFRKWVGINHTFDGSDLNEAQKQLRQFYAALFELCQDPAVRADGYWGLRYHNRHSNFSDCPDAFYTFARFRDGGERLLLVAANFDHEKEITGNLRIPAQLADVCALPDKLAVRLRLDRSGKGPANREPISRSMLIERGFTAMIPARSAHVYVIDRR